MQLFTYLLAACVFDLITVLDISLLTEHWPSEITDRRLVTDLNMVLTANLPTVTKWVDWITQGLHAATDVPTNNRHNYLLI